MKNHLSLLLDGFPPLPSLIKSVHFLLSPLTCWHLGFMGVLIRRHHLFWPLSRLTHSLFGSNITGLRRVPPFHDINNQSILSDQNWTLYTILQHYPPFIFPPNFRVDYLSAIDVLEKFLSFPSCAFCPLLRRDVISRTCSPRCTIVVICVLRPEYTGTTIYSAEGMIVLIRALSWDRLV